MICIYTYEEDYIMSILTIEEHLHQLAEDNESIRSLESVYRLQKELSIQMKQH